MKEIEKLDARVREMRTLADELLVQAAQAQVLVRFWIATGEEDLDSALDMFADEREGLATLFEQIRGQADDELRQAIDRIAPAVFFPSDDEGDEGDQDISEDRDLELDDQPKASSQPRDSSLAETMKLPFQRPLEPQELEGMPLSTKSPRADDHLETASSNEPDAVGSEVPPQREDDFAGPVERNPWSPSDADENASSSSSSDVPPERPSARHKQGPSESSPLDGPGADAVQARSETSLEAIKWEEELSSMLDRSSQPPHKGGTPRAREAAASRPPAGGGGLEEILSGYLKDQD